jgi:MOSC domain-containing protein YiiM
MTDLDDRVQLEAVLKSIQVGRPRVMGEADADDPQRRLWESAIFKEPVAGPVWLGRTNLAGDRQADLSVHGGPDKAVNVYASEHYALWEEELQLGPMSLGAFGENFTTGGLIENAACIGDVFAVGEATVQISQPRQPCWKLARRWGVKDLAVRVQETGRTGWYFRVLREGHVEAGQPMALVERPHPEWTIAAANEVMYRGRHDAAANAALAECAALSESWRGSLLRRV